MLYKDNATSLQFYYYDYYNYYDYTKSSSGSISPISAKLASGITLVAIKKKEFLGLVDIRIFLALHNVIKLSSKRKASLHVINGEYII